MTPDYARTIGDGYLEYVDDELGYNYHAWEVISASESKRHQRIQLADSAELDELQTRYAPLSDLERWALARRHLQTENPHGYFDLVTELVEGDLKHPAMHYPEIFADLARQRAKTGDLDTARTLIEKMEQQWPQFEEAIPLLLAQLQLKSGDIDGATAAFEDALEPHGDDVDLLFETAQDFHRAGSDSNARRWLEKARAAALEHGDSASLVDIELLARSLEDEADKADEADDDEQPVGDNLQNSDPG